MKRCVLPWHRNPYILIVFQAIPDYCLDDDDIESQNAG